MASLLLRKRLQYAAAWFARSGRPFWTSSNFRPLTLQLQQEVSGLFEHLEIFFSSVSRHHRWTLRSWISFCTAPGMYLVETKELKDELLSRYDKRDSPPVDLPIPVKIGITLLSLQSPDESSLVSTYSQQSLKLSWSSPAL